MTTDADSFCWPTARPTRDMRPGVETLAEQVPAPAARAGPHGIPRPPCAERQRGGGRARRPRVVVPVLVTPAYHAKVDVPAAVDG